MGGLTPGTPLRWAVVLGDLDPIVGSEQAGRRRLLIVSYEPFHSGPNVTVCPISGRAPKRPGEVPLPNGHAGQTRDAVILVHQLRTIAASRIFSWEVVGGHGVEYVTDPAIRRAVRAALTEHFGLDIPDVEDGAALA